jgi:hypothetical protein
LPCINANRRCTPLGLHGREFLHGRVCPRLLCVRERVRARACVYAKLRPSSEYISIHLCSRAETAQNFGFGDAKDWPRLVRAAQRCFLDGGDRRRVALRRRGVFLLDAGQALQGQRRPETGAAVPEPGSGRRSTGSSWPWLKSRMSQAGGVRSSSPTNSTCSVIPSTFNRRVGVYFGLVPKFITFRNKANRMVYLSWKSDKNAQKTTKSGMRVDLGAGISDANVGFGYAREREPKQPEKGVVMIGPGDSSTLELPTSQIFVTISSESEVFEGSPPCIFVDRTFSAKNCKGYTIREKKFKNHSIEDAANGQFVCVSVCVCVHVCVRICCL